MLARIALQTLRTRILINLDRAYPNRLDAASLHALESDSPGTRVITRELHYLAEKGFVSITKGDGGSIGTAITSKGRDFVMGEFEETGITPASDYGYTGK